MFYNTFIDDCSTIDIYMILFTPIYDIHCQCFNCDHKYYHVVIILIYFPMYFVASKILIESLIPSGLLDSR